MATLGKFGKACLGNKPQSYHGIESELLQSLKSSWRGRFLQDNPGFSAGSRTFGIGLRIRLAPLESKELATAWTSFVTCFRRLDPRFPHDRVDSNRLVPDPGSRL
jgi:hypothetical protein